jgi:3-isopropylmalate/(R)-2-methylmalate dehydratase large subunit
VPAFTVQIAEGVKLMKEFAKEVGAKMYKEGDGIEHVVLIEDGQIVPWDIVLGTDSHTDTNGALGTLAFGVGTTDSLYAMATGHLYDFMVPESVKFELTGTRPKASSRKIFCTLSASWALVAVPNASQNLPAQGCAACRWTPAPPSVTWPSR